MGTFELTAEGAVQRAREGRHGQARQGVELFAHNEDLFVVHEAASKLALPTTRLTSSPCCCAGCGVLLKHQQVMYKCNCVETLPGSRVGTLVDQR